MLKCDKQTYIDLDFPAILKLLKEYCVGQTAASLAENLRPANKKEELLKYLQQTKELVDIRREGIPFPALDFEELTKEIKRLPILNITLSQESFSRIRLASETVNSILFFFKKNDAFYPSLQSFTENIEFTKEIIKAIDKIFDRNGDLKNDASASLSEIRSQLAGVRKKNDTTFNRTVRKYLKKGFLSDTKEGFLDQKRVLAVISSYKKDVNGKVLGSSNTGNVVFIEPSETSLLNKEFEQLLEDERSEIFSILKKLTEEIRVFLPLIKGYQHLLTKFDFINAKTRLALLLDAHLPAVNDTQNFDLIDCYHPILRLNNKKLGKETISQHIVLQSTQRMLVISGPNAGGKSITLKTVGLLQLMLQCGLLIPVHPNSNMGLFNRLLTDIGDNQSIENELSTYSYRLKRMKYFLKVADKNTLLLLDEFGTGSDPELGGALAEVFFETLYDKQCFGVITTHYGNIKLKADELSQAINGCMLFDAETLMPLYQFSLGQPGSSFTFEVAQMNGISTELINKAKTKLDDKKVKMDQLLRDLQREKTYLEKLKDSHIEAQDIAEEHRQYHQEAKERYEDKLNRLRQNAEDTNKYVSHGKKMEQFIHQFKINSRKKEMNKNLLEEVKKYILKEKTKIEEAKLAQRLSKQSLKAKKKKKVKSENENIRQEKIVVGSKVKLISSKQTGEVIQIDDDKITVEFGFARLKVKRQQLIRVD